MNDSKWVKIPQNKYTLFIRREYITGLLLKEGNDTDFSIATSGGENDTLIHCDSVQQRQTLMHDILSI